MFERDLLVSFIALGLGLLMFFSAMLNYEKAFQLNTPLYLTQTLGRTGARLVMAFVGLFVVTLGVWILATPILTESQFLRKESLRNTATPNLDTEGLSGNSNNAFPPLVTR